MSILKLKTESTSIKKARGKFYSCKKQNNIIVIFDIPNPRTMQRSHYLSLLLIITVIAYSCSILKKDDPEADIRTFLVNFQNNIHQPDDQILQNFQVKQKPEAVLSIIRILQNKEAHISCIANFSQADITFSESEIKVIVPSSFSLQGVESEDSTTVSLVLWLKSKDKTFVISRLEGEEFYQAFTNLKNSNAWALERQAAIESRLWTYEKAKELEAKFDSVIWFTNFGDKKYFYVVQGEWNNYFMRFDTKSQKNLNAKMGLADSEGEIVIPMEYDLVGSLGFDHGNFVEVMKDGKYGYFHVDDKQLIVEPVYDMLIPYPSIKSIAIVKKDSVFGYISRMYEYVDGFPDKQAQQFVERFGYLSQTVKLAASNKVFCEIPLLDHAGYGIIMPPSYLTRHGLFDIIEGGISTTSHPINGWTDFKETKGTWLQSLREGMTAVITSVSERYLEGREEFYNSSTIAFVNSQYDTLAVAAISGTELSIRAVDSTLLEVRTPHDWWFYEDNLCEETNLELHTYFSLGPNGTVTALTSHRAFPQTQFVKLDSSYITGNFKIYNAERTEEISTKYLSLLTLNAMRDEILAD